MVLFFSPCLAGDDTTLVVFSRHTFRGISTKVAPQKIFLHQYGVAVPIPNLSYGENATPQGLIIAESFAAPALQEAAALAVGAIAENKVSMVIGMKFAPSLPPSAPSGQDCIS